jgi:hypothetical protein
MNPASTAIRSTIRFSAPWIGVSGVRHISGASEGSLVFSTDDLLLLFCFTIYITDQHGHHLQKLSGIKCIKKIVMFCAKRRFFRNQALQAVPSSYG